MKPTYPALAQMTYSLSRLAQAWPRLLKTGILAVGGELMVQRGPNGAAQSWLQGQGLIIAIGDLKDPEAAHPQNGDNIIIEVTTETIERRPDGFAVPTAILRQVTTRQQSERPWGGPTPHRIHLWQKFLTIIRQFLAGRSLLEVNTSSLVVCPGMEPHLEPFVTEWRWGTERRSLFLPTSPEIELKKLLARGWTDIFEIKLCYRNEELSPQHRPEFWMLEWYRAFSDLRLIADDLANLLEALNSAGLVMGPLPPLRTRTVAEVFRQRLDLNLNPHTTREELWTVARRHGHPLNADVSWNEIFELLFVTYIDPFLEAEGPLLLTHYPPSQAALARLTTDGWADRFEFYWRGFEIANAFNELNDPEEQRRRFAADQLDRTELGRTPVPTDEEFLRALEAGMPPSGGIALGLERLFLACQGLKSLDELRLSGPR